MATLRHPSRTRAVLSRKAGVGLETLRFYEQKGLLPPPRRNASGYRVYTDSDEDRLRFIRRAQELGFSLGEIKELLEITGSIRTPRRIVREFAVSRLDLIRRKIRDLQAMEQALDGLVARCDGKGSLKGCPIAEFLGAESTAGEKGECHE